MDSVVQMSTFTTVPLALATLLLSLQPLMQSAAATDGEVTPLADIPNVTVATYEVTGRSTAAIRRAINAARPTDVNDGLRVDGLSRWYFNWRWHRDAQGKCSATLEDIEFSATVTMPRLADPKAPASVRKRFDRFLQSLLAHEDGHVRYAWDHRGEIVAAINAADCSTAQAAAKAAVKAIAANDIAYDKATRHGAITILPFN